MVGLQELPGNTWKRVCGTGFNCAHDLRVSVRSGNHVWLRADQS